MLVRGAGPAGLFAVPPQLQDRGRAAQQSPPPSLAPPSPPPPPHVRHPVTPMIQKKQDNDETV